MAKRVLFSFHFHYSNTLMEGSLSGDKHGLTTFGDALLDQFHETVLSGHN
jgi:hypothetical protein